jgi:DNA-directed RNA polymerase
MAEMPNEERGSRPVPDPTVLTTEALQREVLNLRELIETRISWLERLLTERIDGQVAVRQEEFRGVKDKLNQTERQRVEQKEDTKAAVDAALSAAKEAVKEQTIASERSIAKSEAATTKSIEQLCSTFDTALEGQRREVADLKERLTTVEQRKVGSGEAEGQRREQQSASGALMGVIFGAAGVLVAVAAVVASNV